MLTRKTPSGIAYAGTTPVSTEPFAAPQSLRAPNPIFYRPNRLPLPPREEARIAALDCTSEPDQFRGKPGFAGLPSEVRNSVELEMAPVAGSVGAATAVT